MANQEGIAEAIGKFYEKKALPPASPWIDAVAPSQPKVEVRPGDKEGWAEVRWTDAEDEPLRFWCLYMKVGTVWVYDLLPPNVTSKQLPLTGMFAMSMAGVSAVDLAHQESEPVFVPLTAAAPAAAGAGGATGTPR